MNGDLVKRRIELWTHLVAYEVRKAYAGSALGLLWAVVEPLLFLATYFILFVVILQVNRDGRTGLDVLILMFSGLVPWLYFANTVSRGMSTLNVHAPLIKQINFPIGLLPFVTVAHVTVEVIISLALLLALSWWGGYLAVTNLLLVPALMLFALFLVGLASLLGCYAIMLPDLQKLLPTALRVGIFMTPVLYLPSQMPENVRFLAYVNPISYFISPIRYAVLGEPGVFLLGLPQDLLICVGLTVLILAIAYANRHYVRRKVVDYL